MSLNNHFVYILLCSDNTLYTGYSNNVSNRVMVHNSKKGAKYTAARLPVKVLFTKKFEDKSTAMSFEAEFKHKTRKQKLLYIVNNSKIIYKKALKDDIDFIPDISHGEYYIAYLQDVPVAVFVFSGKSAFGYKNNIISTTQSYCDRLSRIAVNPVFEGIELPEGLQCFVPADEII